MSACKSCGHERGSAAKCQACGAEKRLGGKGIKIRDRQLLDRVHVYKLPSMEAAREKFMSTFTLQPWRKLDGHPEMAAWSKRLMEGDNRLEPILQKADALIDQALLTDPRLVRKSGWVRSDEGVEGCPALFMAGDERPMFDRRKVRLGDRAHTDPVRIVISTDSKHITEDNAAAFIAAAKLAQQFRPLEIWWQGAWLKEETSDPPEERGFGHVFLVPLVSGDLDFARLQFVLSDEKRDACSFFIMVAHAYPRRMGWGGKVGDQSYLDDTFDFIRESGMKATANQVAAYAAHWAGMEPRWATEPDEYGAKQYWRPDRPYQEPALTPAEKTERAREQKEWERQCKERERQEKEKRAHEARKRLEAL